jgi:hypothetical protein
MEEKIDADLRSVYVGNVCGKEFSKKTLLIVFFWFI